jgi:hypothetical protein
MYIMTTTKTKKVQLSREAIVTIARAVAETHDSFCLDNAAERVALAEALARALFDGRHEYVEPNYDAEDA